jgi:3-oxoacyl-[acyl-carrier-protein] synthase-3
LAIAIEADTSLGLDPVTNARTVFTRRTSSLLGVQVIGCGSYVPEQVITNADLNQRFGFDANWIEQRTGILERRHCPPGMATSDMAVEAGRRAVRNARIDPQEIDLLVVGTFTPDFQCPSTACLVQDQLGLDCPAFDTAAACAGFMYAMITAAQFVATGNARYALVVGADTNSRIVNPSDQRTYPLFGDGAGAVLLARGEPHQGFLCYQMGSDGSGGPLLDRPAGGTRTPLTHDALSAGAHFLKMDGRSVFKWAVRLLTDTTELLLEKSGMTVHDVGLYLFHQANVRIISSAAEQLGIPQDRVFNNLQRYGNTSGGSIPIVLDEALQSGRIERGDTVLMCGFGAGLSWGTALVQW